MKYIRLLLGMLIILTFLLGYNLLVPREVEKKIQQYQGEYYYKDLEEIENMLALADSRLDIMIASMNGIYEKAKKIEERRIEHKRLELFLINYITKYKKISNLDVFTIETVANTILRYSELRNLDPLLVLAVAEHESNFNPRLVCSSKDTGIMQIIPSTGRQLARHLGISNYSYDMLFNIDTNINLGTFYLKQSIDFFNKKGYKDSVYLGLIGYNRGITRSYNELLANKQVTIYADTVIKKYNRIKKEYKEFSLPAPLQGQL